MLLFFFFTLWLIFTITIFYWLQAERQQEIKKTANLHMAFAQAVRSYTADTVRPTVGTQDKFHAITVPSFAAKNVLDLLHKEKEGFVYKEVALNPTNLKNKANEQEAAVIARFRQNSDLGELEFTKADKKDKFFIYAKPIRVKKTCLQCHSDPKKAPLSVINSYGTQHGFGWKENEVVAAQIITVPHSKVGTNFVQYFLAYSGSLFLIFVAIYVILRAMVRDVVLRPAEDDKKRWKDMACKDYLTKIANRRYFFESSQALMKKALDKKAPVCLIMVDIDNFKSINDTLGHSKGDEVLLAVANVLSTNTPVNSIVGRLGGEEFAITLTELKGQDAYELAKSIVNKIASEVKVPLVDKVTVSAGVSELQDPGESLDDLLVKADKLLYRSKQEGKNRASFLRNSARS